jgi:peptide chain release factor subunit 1
MEVAKNIDIIEELVVVADNFGTKVELISSDSEEGDMFLRAFGGLAGVMRYKMNMT